MVYTPKTEDMFFLRGTYLVVRDSDGVRYLTTERPFMRHHSQLESLDNPNDNLGPMFYDERTGELVLYFAPHPPAKGRGLVALRQQMGGLAEPGTYDHARRCELAPQLHLGAAAGASEAPELRNAAG